MIRRYIGVPLLVAVLTASLFGGLAGAHTTFAAPTTTQSSEEQLSARGSFSWDSWWSYWRWGANRPLIRSIEPSSGEVGTTVTLTGRRFNDESIVRFGKGTITNPTVSDDGRTLTFVVPEDIGKYCPPYRVCTPVAYEVDEGDYRVRVQNGHRTSNSKTFEVTEDNPDSDGPLELDSITGPTALHTGEEGSWTLNVESDGEGNLSYSVKWGDEPTTLTRASLTSGVQSSSTFTHTYDTPGTYEPEFTVADQNGNTVTKKAEAVVVTDENGNEEEAPHIDSISPQSAEVGATVTLTGTGFDATSTVQIGSTTASNIDVNSSTSLTFTIPSIALGTYSVRVIDDGGTSNAVDLTVATSAEKSKISISGLSAPTTLDVGENGSWTVNVDSNADGNLTYSVEWGDSGPLLRGLRALGLMTQSSSTFMHSYDTPGTYHPKFTVTDAKGAAASVSSSVKVMAIEE